MKIKISINDNISLYQKLAPKIKELKVLGMNNIQIMKKLKIGQKTIIKSIKFIDETFNSNLNL